MVYDNWKSVLGVLKKDFFKVRSFTKDYLGVEAELLKTNIVSLYYSGRPGLKRRSGTAAKGWQLNQGAQGDDYFVRIFNDVPYADHSKEKEIRPKKGKYLAIPIGKSLTKAGVPRFSGPRDASLPKLSLIPLRNKNGFLMVDAYKKRGKGKSPAYFLLIDKVKTPAYTAGLMPYVEKEAERISNNYGIQLGVKIGLFK